MGIAGALSLWWDVQVTILEQVCWGGMLSLEWDVQVTVLEQVCLGGALSLWWDVQVTVLEQVCSGGMLSLEWDVQVTVLEQVCVGGALSLWWDAQITVLGQVCGGHWCIVAVVGCKCHHTGTGEWRSLLHCHCGRTSRSPYWDRCVGATGVLSLWWDKQVTVLGQVCGGCWCIATVVGGAGHCTGAGVSGLVVHSH